NRERYELFRWAQQAFKKFRVIPPSTGICHQVNLEYLAPVVRQLSAHGLPVVFPDSVVGTDSHTTMINGLGVAGWGVGGIEAEAVMLGEPLYMTAPAVIGFKLTGTLPEDVTATDLVLTVTELLRKKGVVGKFVEFYGPGLSSMSVPDRATVANMAPEYGATMGYFPVDDRTLDYLRSTGRPEALVALVEQYCRCQGLFRTDATPAPAFHETVELDMAGIRPSLAGPSRPQDRIELSRMKTCWHTSLTASAAQRGFNLDPQAREARAHIRFPDRTEADITHGAVVLAAITSCTNTSNPSVMLGAGLLAKKAAEAGLVTKPWVKTSFSPGSIAVTEYLKETGLLPFLEKLGFYVTGYGCATCIGNSGPLPGEVERAIDAHKLVAACVVSGNRNFEGRINPHVRASFLASPPLVVAYALAGTVDLDLTQEPLGNNREGMPVFLKDIWPQKKEIEGLMSQALSSRMFRHAYKDIEQANKQWNEIPITEGVLFSWKNKSTYIQEPPYFTPMAAEAQPVASIKKARVLVMLGSSVTTDHISPAGSIRHDSPAGTYLIERAVQPENFNSYGSRRGNHLVMVRGTFANIRLRNLLAPATEGGWTTYLPAGEVMSIYEAALKYQAEGIPSLVIAGRDYGMGSSRDWAAKGTQLLGIRAVIAESYERIHRSNLAGMGVLPLQFKEGE
ncbi:MAG: aconitate hydratase AcnA, partial [Pseudomonadota bacterium]